MYSKLSLICSVYNTYEYSKKVSTTTVNRRLIELTCGYRNRILLAVLIGGHDICSLSLSELRNIISVVQQDAYLFNTTIRENIRIGKANATDPEIEDAARKACIQDFIASLPDGYDTMLGERGAKLSGGQRQRISIARALLKDAPILILDEATSNLDSENEQAIRNGIDNLMKGRTTLIIAHRLSTIVTADRVIVMDHGQVVENGTHTDLMDGEGMYARIISVQRNVINER